MGVKKLIYPLLAVLIGGSLVSFYSSEIIDHFRSPTPSLSSIGSLEYLSVNSQELTRVFSVDWTPIGTLKSCQLMVQLSFEPDDWRDYAIADCRSWGRFTSPDVGVATARVVVKSLLGGHVAINFERLGKK